MSASRWRAKEKLSGRGARYGEYGCKTTEICIVCMRISKNTFLNERFALPLENIKSRADGPGMLIANAKPWKCYIMYANNNKNVKKWALRADARKNDSQAEGPGMLIAHAEPLKIT
jgi:hypothetical protein